MRKASRSVAALCAGAVCAALAGCTYKDVIHNDDYKRITFSWWGNAERNEPTLEGLKNFTEEHNITVIPRYGEFSGFKALMDANINSGSAADVMQLNYDWVYQYSPDGEGLYDLYQLSDIIDLDAFPEGSLDSMVIDGKLQGVPTALNAVSFVYNKDIYDSYGLEIPRTWEDLFAAAAVMKKDGVYPTAISEKQIWLSAVAYCEQVTGRRIFDDKGFELTQEQLEIMIEFYVRLIDEGVTKIGSEFDRMDYSDGVVAGVTAWATDADYYGEISEDLGIDIVLGEYLTTDAPLSFGWYVKPSSVYSIRKDTFQPEEAARLVDYLANDGSFATLCETTRGVPVSRSAQEALEARGMLTGVDVDAADKIIAEPSLDPMSPFLENQGLIDAFIAAGESVRYGQAEVPEAAKTAIEAMNRAAAGFGKT